MEIQIFENAEFGQIRTVGDYENPKFCLADLCRALEIGNPSDVKNRLEEGVVSIETLQTNGGNQKMIFVNEDGLYDVILDSRKPEAKKFRKWITSEVLPSIRKSGVYATADFVEKSIADPAWAIRILTTLQKERLEKARLQEVVEVQAVQIAEMEPKASYYDLILQSKGAIPVSVIAKDYGLSAKALNKILHELKIQYYCAETWLVYQNYAAQGYTVTKTFQVSDEHSKIHTYWTQKGRLFLYEILKQNGYLPLIEQS